MTKNTRSLLSKLLDLEFLLRLPSSIKLRLNRLYHEKLIFRLASKESVFSNIWRNNYFGSGESLSGPGSTLEQTANLRQKMPAMFDEYNIKLVFDAPCADIH